MINDDKYPDIIKVLIYKQNHFPEYHYHIYKNFRFVKIKIVLYDKGKIYERYIYNNSNIVIRSSTYYWSNSLHILKCQTPILTTTKKRKKLRV